MSVFIYIEGLGIRKRPENIIELQCDFYSTPAGVSYVDNTTRGAEQSREVAGVKEGVVS